MPDPDNKPKGHDPVEEERYRPPKWSREFFKAKEPKGPDRVELPSRGCSWFALEGCFLAEIFGCFGSILVVAAICWIVF
mgnify:CR=1 FL=1